MECRCPHGEVKQGRWKCLSHSPVRQSASDWSYVVWIQVGILSTCVERAVQGQHGSFRKVVDGAPMCDQSASALCELHGSSTGPSTTSSDSSIAEQRR
jgi:hypothetical protein